jgi:hypothetical protein
MSSGRVRDRSDGHRRAVLRASLQRQAELGRDDRLDRLVILLTGIQRWAISLLPVSPYQRSFAKGSLVNFCADWSLRRAAIASASARCSLAAVFQHIAVGDARL